MEFECLGWASRLLLTIYHQSDIRVNLTSKNYRNKPENSIPKAVNIEITVNLNFSMQLLTVLDKIVYSVFFGQFWHKRSFITTMLQRNISKWHFQLEKSVKYFLSEKNVPIIVRPNPAYILSKAEKKLNSRRLPNDPRLLFALLSTRNDGGCLGTCAVKQFNSSWTLWLVFPLKSFMRHRKLSVRSRLWSPRALKTLLFMHSRSVSEGFARLIGFYRSGRHFWLRDLRVGTALIYLSVNNSIIFWSRRLFFGRWAEREDACGTFSVVALAMKIY